MCITNVFSIFLLQAFGTSEIKACDQNLQEK